MRGTLSVIIGLTLLTASLVGFADERADEIDRLEASSSANFVRTPPHAVLVRPRLVTAYNLRIYPKGNELGLQIDIKNVGTAPAFGPNVSVKLHGIGEFRNAAIYPYYGGDTSRPNTIFPGDLGYIVVTLPPGVRVVQGQPVTVAVFPKGKSNFSKFGGSLIGCPKGTAGCE